MNDAEFEAQKARVMAVWERWARPLGMGWQRKLVLSWYRGAIPNHPDAAMTCWTDWQYKDSKISVDLTRVGELDERDLEFAVVHELMHVFLGGLIDAHRRDVDRDAFRMIEEHTATQLAQALLWLRASCEADDAERELSAAPALAVC